MKATKKTAGKRARGRPKVDSPQLNATIRFDPELVAELDAWAKDNGDMGRSAAIRFMVKQYLRRDGSEKTA